MNVAHAPDADDQMREPGRADEPDYPHVAGGICSVVAVLLEEAGEPRGGRGDVCGVLQLRVAARDAGRADAGNGPWRHEPSVVGR